MEQAVSKGMAAAQAGKALGVGRQYVYEAKKLLQSGCVVALDILPLLEAQAKKRQAIGHFNAPQYKGQKPVSQQVDKGRATEQAGKALNVNRQYVYEAKKLLQSGCAGGAGCVVTPI